MLLLVFHVSDRRYALHLEAVEQVIRALAITPLPYAPEEIAGVINVHGRIIPVLDVRKHLGLPCKEMELNDHLIVAHTSKWPLALWVDRVSEVLDYPIIRQVPMQEILPDGSAVEGVIKLEGGLAFIEDLDRFYLPLPQAPGGHTP